jgi:hypothetical protein
LSIFFAKYSGKGLRLRLTSIHFEIDRHNAAVETRKGTLAVSAILWAAVVARMVYWIIFLRFAVVGIVSVDGRVVLVMEKGAVGLGLYILCCVLPTDSAFPASYESHHTCRY